jgi:hypothetical protein
MTSVFLHWVYKNIDKLDMSIISRQPEAILYLKENPDKIDWDAFSENSDPDAIELIENNLNKVNWKNLSRNKGAYKLLLCNKQNIDWNELGHNTAPNIHLLYEGNIHKIKNWIPICKNRTPWIIKILDNNIDKLNKDEILELSSNSTAIPLIEKYLDRINKYGLTKNEYVQLGIYGNIYPSAYNIFKYLNNKINCYYCASPIFVSYLKQNRDKINRNIYLNKNPYAIELIEWYLKSDVEISQYWWSELSANPVAFNVIKNYMDNVNWDALSLNYKAMNILQNNQTKINWKNLSQNSGIYLNQTRFIVEREIEKNKYTIMKQEQEKIIEVPYIDFVGLTINYNEDENYIDNELKPLYEENISDADY